MARRVFLHIGVPKSGTTFLQTTTWHNRRALRAQGFLYPGKRRMDHYHAFRSLKNAHSGRPAAAGGDNAWQKLVGELADWPGTGLVSHEFFSMATRGQARQAVADLAPADVRVVITARDYVRQFPAVWQEALKMTSDLSFDEFMERALAFDLPDAWGWNTQDLPSVLDRWADAVDSDHVHVITVPPPGAPRELLWRRWCEVLDIDDSGFDRDVAFANESLGAGQAALLRRVKPHVSGPLDSRPARHRWVRQYFGHEVLGPQRGERFGPREDQAAELRKLSMLAAEAIDRAGYRVTGDLADLVPEQNAAEGPHPDDVTEGHMLDVAARSIEHMIRDVRRLTMERDRWRAEARDAAAVRPASLPRRIARRTKRWLRR